MVQQAEFGNDIQAAKRFSKGSRNSRSWFGEPSSGASSTGTGANTLAEPAPALLIDVIGTVHNLITTELVEQVTPLEL